MLIAVYFYMEGGPTTVVAIWLWFIVNGKFPVGLKLILHVLTAICH